MEQKDKDYIVRLFPTIQKIKDPGIRDKVISTWYKAWKRSTFQHIEDVHQLEPFRDRIAYSNVEHTNQVCQMCEKMGETVAEMLKCEVQMDYLLAGAVLHDVDKILIYDTKTHRRSETGRQFAHAAMGAMMALMEGLPEPVAHIIGAHSTKFSPAKPNTIEALIVAQVDHLAAGAFYMVQGVDMDGLMKQLS